MLDKLAVVIVGVPHSGKTSTLRHFCNTYNDRVVSTFKEGIRTGIKPFKDKYFGVSITAYFLPSSRTEKDVSLRTMLEKIGWEPDFVFMAEQLNGKEYQNTINLLRKKGYHIKEYVIEEASSDAIWRPYQKKDEEIYLKYRTEAIADYVRDFIRARV